MNAPGNLISRVNPDRHVVVLLLLFYVFVSLLMPHGGGDTTFWNAWAIYIKEHGVRRIYDLHTHPAPGREPSFLYGPVCMYLLYFYSKWQTSVAQIPHTIHQFKSMLLVFDVVGIWVALRYVRDAVDRPFYALFLFFNIGLLYNTVWWGQLDGAIASLTLVAAYCALRGQTALSVISIIAALLIKPQPVVFLPVLGLLWLSTLLGKPLRHTIVSFLAVILVLIIFLFPFIQAGTLPDYWAMLLDSASVYPIVSVNAGNIWNLLLADDPNRVSDAVVRFGLTYKQWGLIMFSISYAVILYPVFRQFSQIVLGKRTSYDTSVVLLTLGLVPLIFYLFNTQMHERYAHPGVLLLGAYGLSKGDFVPYIVASIANFWVMDRFLNMSGLHELYAYIPLELVAVLFLFVLVWGVVQLYKKPVAVKRDVALV